MASQPNSWGTSPSVPYAIQVVMLNPQRGVEVNRQMNPNTTVLVIIDMVVNEKVSSEVRPLRTVIR